MGVSVINSERDGAVNYPIYRWGYFIVVLLTVTTLWLGLSLPMMSLERFWIFRSEVSILQAVATLFQHDEWLLAVLVGLFSITLPSIKLIFLALRAIKPAALPVVTNVLTRLSHWAMLDVFLVAVLIAVIKISGLATAQSESGLYWLVAATLSTYLLSYWPSTKV